MNSAERKLPASERDQYQQQLYRVCERAHRMAPIYWLAINASAEQRAEAFLRTIRKWSGSSRAAGVDCSLSNPSTEEKGHNEKLRDDDEQTAP